MSDGENTVASMGTADDQSQCPCCSGRPFPFCCEPILADPTKATTPTELMRSRYTAFVYHNSHHLVATHHPSERSRRLAEELEASFRQEEQQWLGLQIVAASSDQVEFIARYRIGQDKPSALHEVSRFVFDGGQWYYLNGTIQAAKPPGRNDPCWCQSGKKAKRCCFQ